MELRQLRHFVAVVEHGGFSAASRATFVSQPALSLAVQQLERELGAVLFDRVGRRVLLTAVGEAFLGPARQVLRDLETGIGAVGAVTGLVAGSLALACLPTLAADPVAGYVGGFRRRYPGVRIDLAAPENSDELFDIVSTGEAELGVTEAYGVPDSLAVRCLGSQALALILPPGTPAADSGTDLAGVPFIATPIGTSTRRLLDEYLSQGGHRTDLSVVTAQRDAILPLVLAGAGAALVPESLARIAEQLGATTVRRSPPAVRQLVLVHRPGHLSPAAVRLADMMTPL